MEKEISKANTIKAQLLVNFPFFIFRKTLRKTLIFNFHFNRHKTFFTAEMGKFQKLCEGDSSGQLDILKFPTQSNFLFERKFHPSFQHFLTSPDKGSKSYKNNKSAKLFDIGKTFSSFSPLKFSSIVNFPNFIESWMRKFVV
jgi:hypothetical protein